MHITTSTTVNKILHSFFEDVDFPKTEDRKYLEDCLAKLCENSEFVNALNLYRENCMTDGMVLSLSEKIAEETGVHPYTVSLLMLISFTDELKTRYKNKGIPEEIYKKTICDLKYKAEEGKLVKGVCGTFCAQWLFRYFLLDRFAFGRLQFQFDPLGVDFKDLTAESICLKIHIPRSGEPLTPESIDSSIAQAKEFFKDRITSPLPVICSSYLLFEDFKSVFRPGSNLEKFVSRFEIISSTPDETDDYPNLWRLFDMDYTGNIEDYPETTSLYRNIKDYLRSGGKTGIGLGIFFC